MKIGVKEGVIILLVILLMFALGYIGYAKWQQRDSALISYGYQLGYQQAVVSLVEQSISANCQQPVPVYAPVQGQNVSLNLIPVECFAQSAVNETY